MRFCILAVRSSTTSGSFRLRWRARFVPPCSSSVAAVEGPGEGLAGFIACSHSINLFTTFPCVHMYIPSPVSHLPLHCCTTPSCVWKLAYYAAESNHKLMHVRLCTCMPCSCSKLMVTFSNNLRGTWVVAWHMGCSSLPEHVSLVAWYWNQAQVKQAWNPLWGLAQSPALQTGKAGHAMTWQPAHATSHHMSHQADIAGTTCRAEAPTTWI